VHHADPDTFLIGTFGFLLAHKGTLELIRALRLLLDDGLDVQLIAVCAIHPDPSSNSYRSECVAEIRKLGLQDRVTLATDYVPDETAMELLSMTDVIALPYAETNESSSAALRFVLPIGRPVVVTDLPIFDDAREVLEHVPAPVDPNELAAKIRSLMNDPARRDRLAEASKGFCRQNSWASVARSTLSVYQEAAGRDQAQFGSPE
jgi:glycosyltransferase involved in cell wall biosynthesis